MEHTLLGLAVQNDTVVLLLEPLHCVLLRQAVNETDLAGLASSLGDVVSWACKERDKC